MGGNESRNDSRGAEPLFYFAAASRSAEFEQLQQQPPDDCASGADAPVTSTHVMVGEATAVADVAVARAAEKVAAAKAAAAEAAAAAAVQAHDSLSSRLLSTHPQKVNGSERQHESYLLKQVADGNAQQLEELLFVVFGSSRSLRAGRGLETLPLATELNFDVLTTQKQALQALQ